MKKIGISTWQLQEKYGDFKALEIAKNIGADAVDFAMANKRFDYRVEGSLYNKSDEEIIKYFSELKAYADELGIFVCQTHGHDCGFKNKKDEDDALVENIRLNLLATAALGAPVCVIHNATSLHMGANPDPELMHSLSYDLFTRTLPYAKQYNVKLATETFGDAYKIIDFFGDINEFMKAYNTIKSIDEYKDYFTTCVDTGHSNKAMRYDNPTPADVIRRLGKEVTCLHLNDNDTLTDQHKMPLSGCIDWENVMNALDEIGYNGIYNMELNLRHFGEALIVDYAEFAIKVMRNILDKRDNK